MQQPCGHSAAALEGENYQEALEGFQKVVDLENNEKGEWYACRGSGMRAYRLNGSLHRQLCSVQLWNIVSINSDVRVLMNSGGSRHTSRSSRCTTGWATPTRCYRPTGAGLLWFD